MVEFGLKLEDNKVADWSDRYIEYEKLKAILKKSKSAVQRLQDLREKKPQEVEAAIDRFRKGLPTPFPSQNDLASLDTNSLRSVPRKSEHGDNISLKGITEGSERSSAASETAKLVEAQPTTTFYGGTADIPFPPPQPEELQRTDSSGNLISRAFYTAASGVSDYFQKSFERTVRETLKDIDKNAEEFEECLNENIQKVNTFYNQKLEELQDRVAYLRESVQQIRGTATAPELNDDVDAEMETPLVQHRRRHHREASDAITFAKNLALKVQSHMRPPLPPTPQDSTEEMPSLPTSEKEDDHEESIDKKHLREADSIQRALVDHYRSAKLLNNFAIMNYTGFVKIVKKHDKTMPDRKGRYKKAIAPEKICNEGKAVEELAARMERLYAIWFCDRNISEARAQMLTKKGDGLEMDWSQLRLGYRMGMCSILGLWVCWDCIWGLVHEGRSTIGGRTAFPVFRGCGGLLLLQWCWGFSVWVWSRYRVNYIYLFDFNPSIVNSPLAIFNEAVDHTLFYLVCTLLYYKAGAHDIPGSFPAGVFPFILVVYTSYQLLFPLRTRAPMWQAIGEVVTSPMTSPTFFHGYIGDIFTSLVKVFQDLAWTFFFVFSGDWMISEDRKASTKHRWARHVWYSQILIPLLTLLPLWIRFNQCLRRYTDTGKRFPHLANAFKYALSQTVTLFGAFHPLYMRNKTESDIFQAFWMFAFVASSLYSFCWDLFQVSRQEFVWNKCFDPRMTSIHSLNSLPFFLARFFHTKDWGLGQREYNFLGPRLMYPKRAMYYSIIGIDLVLRFAWVLTLLPPESGAAFALPAYLTLVSMMLEIFRRTVWGFLRLENEHRSNTAGFRRVDFVPLHFSTGHTHGYKQEEPHRGASVLVEVAVVTILVLGAAVVSVVAAQHATERERARNGEL